MTYLPATGLVADNDYGDINVTSSGMAWEIKDAAVQLDDIENINTSRILGRTDASAGAPQQIILGTNLAMSGTTLNATGGGGGFTIDGGDASSTYTSDPEIDGGGA